MTTPILTMTMMTGSRAKNSNHRGRSNSKSNRKKKEKNRRKDKVAQTKTSRRKLRKRFLEERLISDSYLPGNETMYLKLATTAGVLFSPQSSEILENLQLMYKQGKISDLIILAPGTWADKKIQNRLKGMLSEKGHAWIYNHVVFPLSGENARDFILRIIDAYEITHYFDINKQFLGFVAFSPKHPTIKLHDLNDSGWKGVRGWIVRTVPNYWKLYEQEEDAFHLINTGFYADETKE